MSTSTSPMKDEIASLFVKSVINGNTITAIQTHHHHDPSSQELILVLQDIQTPRLNEVSFISKSENTIRQSLVVHHTFCFLIHSQSLSALNLVNSYEKS